jgi:hypothetical protein
LPRDEAGKFFPKFFVIKNRHTRSHHGMTRYHQWLQDLEGVDALAILTDADLLSHENGHALFYDGLEPLQNQCIMISADPDYFLENLKDVITCS